MVDALGMGSKGKPDLQQESPTILIRGAGSWAFVPALLRTIWQGRRSHRDPFVRKVFVE